MMRREIFDRNGLKNIRDDFTATPNPFNQNLNYEKILRFSSTKVHIKFTLPNFFQKNINFLFNCLDNSMELMIYRIKRVIKLIKDN